MSHIPPAEATTLDLTDAHTSPLVAGTLLFLIEGEVEATGRNTLLLNRLDGLEVGVGRILVVAVGGRIWLLRVCCIPLRRL